MWHEPSWRVQARRGAHIQSCQPRPSAGRARARARAPQPDLKLESSLFTSRDGSLADPSQYAEHRRVACEQQGTEPFDADVDRTARQAFEKDRPNAATLPPVVNRHRDFGNVRPIGITHIACNADLPFRHLYIQRY